MKNKLIALIVLSAFWIMPLTFANLADVNKKTAHKVNKALTVKSGPLTVTGNVLISEEQYQETPRNKKQNSFYSHVHKCAF